MKTAIHTGPLRFNWINDWAQLPPQKGWAHHGLASTRDGKIVAGGATDPEILIFNRSGEFERKFPIPASGTHGITISAEGGRDILWIVDTGGQILKCEMDGAVLARLTKKDFNYAEDDPFIPTGLDVDPANGNVWIADGYGSSRVHRFSSGLKLELTLDGTAGAGRFACPHWVHCDTRQKQTRIYVADRSNDRIQVFNPDGTFTKCIGDGLVTPSAFAPLGEFLAVAELKARLVILDADDAIVGEIGNGREYVKRAGWPNRLDASGSPGCALGGIAEGKFNSPHGMTSDAEGSLYVSEWLIGDRYIKLQRVA